MLQGIIMLHLNLRASSIFLNFASHKFRQVNQQS